MSVEENLESTFCWEQAENQTILKFQWSVLFLPALPVPSSPPIIQQKYTYELCIPSHTLPQDNQDFFLFVLGIYEQVIIAILIVTTVMRY